MLQLQFDHAIESIIDEKIIKEIKKWEDIIVFGAGKSGEWVVELLRHYGMEPKCYCDNYPDKQGQMKNGLLIMSFEGAVSRYSNAAICIGSMWSEEILQQIAEYDVSLVERTWDLLTSMNWETMDSDYVSSEYEYIRNNFEQFEQLYDVLADDESRDTLQGILNYRLTRNKEYLKKIKSNEGEYFDKTLIQFFPVNKEIIDGGAFDGDTVDILIQKFSSPEHHLKIHCYEPEKKDYEKIQKKISTIDWSRHDIILHKTALWSKGGTLGFTGTGLSGKLGYQDADGMNNAVVTECIDDYGFENVGFIKMDIEGAEREALIGARKVIEKNIPILAVCAYHLQDDLLVLPNIIKSMNCNYQLYLRHYMYSSGGTVLYGIQ